MNIPKWHNDERDKKFRAIQIKSQIEDMDRYVNTECNTELGKKVGRWALKCLEREAERLACKRAKIL